MSLALCVLKNEVFDNSHPNAHPDILDFILQDPFKILSLKTKLLPRAECETDENHLQIIPYVTLFDKNTNDVFIYRRGKDSSETRLTGLCSIGVGGHIETSPTRDVGFIDTVVNETVRELNEEVGLPITTELVDTIKTKLTCNNCGAIYYNGDSVGRVHIGLSIFLGVDRNDIKETEATIVSRGQWMSLDTITEQYYNGKLLLENWSRIVMNVRKTVNNF